jgi:Cu2+-containing amine oxidase
VHVPQSSGDGVFGIKEWIGDGTDNIENTDILVFHTFGISRASTSVHEAEEEFVGQGTAKGD